MIATEKAVNHLVKTLKHQTDASQKTQMFASRDVFVLRALSKMEKCASKKQSVKIVSIFLFFLAAAQQAHLCLRPSVCGQN